MRERKINKSRKKEERVKTEEDEEEEEQGERSTVPVVVGGSVVNEFDVLLAARACLEGGRCSRVTDRGRRLRERGQRGSE